MKAKYRPNDFEARLHGGIVLWDQVPVVIVTDGDGNLNIRDIVTQRNIQQDINPLDDRLDVHSFELGYVNTKNGAFYLNRIPHRRYKQSLEARAIVEYHLRDGEAHLGMPGRVNVFGTGDFRDSYTKPFPRFDQAIGLLDERGSVALSRDVALTKDRLGLIKVWFKLEQVGYIETNSRTVKVPSSDKAWVISMYLSELDWIVE